MTELLSDERMAGRQHFGFKLSTDANGERMLGGDANGLHRQYFRSLEANLADAEQDEGDDAGQSVPASSIDKEGEAGASELGTRYPTLQSIYAGKLNKQSIHI